MIKKCVICDAEFNAPPSSKKITCSLKCSKIRKSQTHKGKRNFWNEEAKARKRADGQTENLKKGTLAALKSPNSGHVESNVNAKVWILITPDGKEIEVKNLNLWAEENCDLFDKPQSKKSANQIASGFKSIAQTLAGNRGVPGKHRGGLTYFGWSLKCLPFTNENSPP